MQKKKIENWLYKKIKDKTKTYFLVYIIGIILYGIGSMISLNNNMIVNAYRYPIISVLLFLGILCLITGIVILIRLFYRFYQSSDSKPKLKQCVIIYIIVILITGPLIGGVGKLLYHVTDWQYGTIKLVIWGLSTYIHAILRFVFIYTCLSLYFEKSVDYKNKTFFLFILGLILLFSLSIGMSLLVPVVSQFLMLISDLIVSIGFVYYKLFGLKYNMKLGS